MKLIIGIFIVIWLSLVGLLAVFAAFSLVLLFSQTTINGLSLTDAITSCIFYNTQSLTFINGLRLAIPLILVTFVQVLLVSVTNLVSLLKRQDSPSPISTIMSINLLISLFLMTVGLTLSSRFQSISNDLLTIPGINAINACASRGFPEPAVIAKLLQESIAPARLIIFVITMILIILTLLLYRQRPSIIELNQYFDVKDNCEYCRLSPAQLTNETGRGCMWCHSNWQINELEDDQSADPNNDELRIKLKLNHLQEAPLIKPQISIESNDNFRVREVNSRIKWERNPQQEGSGNHWVGTLPENLTGKIASNDNNILISLDKKGFNLRRELDLTIKFRPSSSQQWSQPFIIKRSLR